MEDPRSPPHSYFLPFPLIPQVLRVDPVRSVSVSCPWFGGRPLEGRSIVVVALVFSPGLGSTRDSCRFASLHPEREQKLQDSRVKPVLGRIQRGAPLQHLRGYPTMGPEPPTFNLHFPSCASSSILLPLRLSLVPLQCVMGAVLEWGTEDRSELNVAPPVPHHWTKWFFVACWH